MKNLLSLLITFTLFLPSFNYSQQKQVSSKILVSGKIIEKTNKTPLEYATVTFKSSSNSKLVFGGITDSKGDFSVEIEPGSYDILYEFISFKTIVINQIAFLANTNLGIVNLEEDFNQLKEVTIRAERTTVDIKLDKKVYNVGKDLMVKGGTVSEILDNIPSVTVDIEGNISLRGNTNVKILLDGRPSNAINITEALRLIPADAIDKVEVITNPSARYDAEGGGGLINIILKKGKNQGLNGSFIANTAYPESYGFTGSINYKSKQFNLFTTQGYNYRNNPGSALTNSRYLKADNSTRDYMNETRNNQRLSKSYNQTLGMEWIFDKSTTWSNIFNYRGSNGTNLDDVLQKYYDVGFNFDYSRNRINLENSSSSNIEYTTNFTKRFKKEGHKLTIDGNFSSNTEKNIADITDSNTLNTSIGIDTTTNIQKQKRNLLQTDYVLPFGEGNQFEAGYRGDFLINTTDYSVVRNEIPFNNFTNILEYKEKVNALYSQLGFKINKLSTLFGLRWEDSNIDVNQLATNDFNNKRYNNFFPSAFLTYEISKETSTSLSYSRRIQRPRGRQLNPFNNFSSNVNLFIGNPDLNPAFTDALDFGYIKRWNTLTFNTSLYANKTTDVFQYVRKESGVFENGVPVIIATPINIATEYRTGFEFTLNYSPYKWWKLNGSLNYFYVETNGDYNYINFNNDLINQNFDFKTTSWFTRLTSKVTLPFKIDWQTNMTYNGEQKNAQGSYLAVFSMNIAFSKDVLNDNGTINFNISDVFNSRKRLMDTYIPGVVDSYGEMQWRERQINLSFTYRFNVQKNDKEKRTRGSQQDENGDF